MRQLLNQTGYYNLPAVRYLEADEYELLNGMRQKGNDQLGVEYDQDPEYYYEDDDLEELSGDEPAAEEKKDEVPYVFEKPVNTFGELKEHYDEPKAFSNVVYASRKLPTGVDAAVPSAAQPPALLLRSHMKDYTQPTLRRRVRREADHGSGGHHHHHHHHHESEGTTSDDYESLDYGLVQKNCKYIPKRVCQQVLCNSKFYLEYVQSKVRPLQEQVCDRVPHLDCKTDYRDKCKRTETQKCKMTYVDKCEKVPWESCSTEYHDECDNEPYEECHTLYDTKCETNYKQVTKYRFEAKCYWPDGQTRKDEPCA